MSVERAIFIVGCPRSGTTLVQSVLSCAPQTATFRESHLFDACLSHVAGRTVPRRMPGPQISRFWTENDLVGSVQGAGVLPNTIADACLAGLLKATAQRGAKVLIEKTPRHLHFIKEIAAACKRANVEAHFVHVLRDGVAVAGSLVEASAGWRRQRTPLEALERWHRDCALSRAKLGQKGHVFTTYEILTRRPVAESLRVADGLDLALDEGDLAGRSEQLSAVIRPDEIWKPTMAEITPSPRRHLDAETEVNLRAEICDTDYRAIADFAEGACG